MAVSSNVFYSVLSVNYFVDLYMNIRWEIKHFKDLTVYELYHIFQLRIAVFCVEQDVAYQDADSKDLNAHHIAGYNEQGELVAYARILQPGVAFNEISVGRVTTSQNVRKEGVGRALFAKALEYITLRYGNIPVRISAQLYLVKFYSSFGFKTVGEQYTEDDLPHIEMLRETSPQPLSEGRGCNIR